jgi:hypothetical protein
MFLGKVSLKSPQLASGYDPPTSTS